MGGVKIEHGDTWCYHPDHEPRLVTNDEAEELYAEGWFDTPAGFEEIKQDAADARIKEANGLNLDDMTKAQIIDYAEENGIEIDKRKKKAEIIAVIEASLEG